MRIRHLALFAFASAIVAAGLSLLHPPDEAPPPSASSSPPLAPEPPPPTLAASAEPAASAPNAQGAAASATPPSDACPTSMVLVDALHCPYLAHRCADRGADGTCWRWAPEALCEGDRRRLRFCIDRLEYPNLESVRAATSVSFAEAERACAAEEKRLCRVAEWELACEGAGMWPFPTGVRRDPRVCAVDGPAGREASGRRPSCRSPFGVVDLVGGVDEWIVDDAGSKVQPPFRWVRGGGSWRRGRACRDHVRNEAARGSDVSGFRCCSDAAAPDGGAEAAAPGPVAPPRVHPDGGTPLGGWIPLELPSDASP